MKMILINLRLNTNSHRHMQCLHFLRKLKKGAWYVFKCENEVQSNPVLTTLAYAMSSIASDILWYQLIAQC
jgi:hypothetical protein